MNVVTVFMSMVVRATWATRATVPRVAKATVPERPPFLICSRYVSRRPTLAPALADCCTVATSTSIGIVTSADRVPPASEHTICGEKESEGEKHGEEYRKEHRGRERETEGQRERNKEIGHACME